VSRQFLESARNGHFELAVRYNNTRLLITSHKRNLFLAASVKLSKLARISIQTHLVQTCHNMRHINHWYPMIVHLMEDVVSKELDYVFVANLGPSHFTI